MILNFKILRLGIVAVAITLATLVARNAADAQDCIWAAQWCNWTNCVNPTVLPEGYDDVICDNGAVFGNECRQVHARMANGPGTQWRIVNTRALCGGAVITDNCGDRFAGAAPGAACNLLVGSCGGRGVTAC